MLQATVSALSPDDHPFTTSLVALMQDEHADDAVRVVQQQQQLRAALPS
jgi:hypothetical protein